MTPSACLIRAAFRSSSFSLAKTCSTRFRIYGMDKSLSLGGEMIHWPDPVGGGGHGVQPGLFDLDERSRALAESGGPLIRLAVLIDFDLFPLVQPLAR